MKSAQTSVVLSEKEETDEITSLLDECMYLCSKQRFDEAAVFSDDALEIDNTSIPALRQSATVAIALKKFEHALWCAARLCELYPENPLGLYVKGETDLSMCHYREAISVLLLSLDMDYPRPQDVSARIVEATAAILSLPGQFIDDLLNLDYYTQLSEVSIALLQAEEFMLVINVLDSALKRPTKQYGVSMRIYLTRGHALYATKQIDDALRSYESCLDFSISVHDITHQTKSLVNMAALLLSKGETYHALVMYERLLNLHSRILSDKLADDALWTDDFLAKLYMNTSMAYKSIGNIDRALLNAQEYFKVCSHNTDYVLDVASAHKHLGILYEIIQDYPTALNHFKKYLGMIKCSGDRRELGLAYGLMGSLYSRIGLWQLTVVYHERHISISAESEDKADSVAAYDMYGDSLMRRGHAESASEMYKNSLQSAGRNVLSRCTALYKLGNSHAMSGSSQHALHYYDEALAICPSECSQLLLDVQFGIGSTVQIMSDSRELERGRKLLDISIQSLKKQIEECMTERKFLSRHYLEQLNKAFEGIQLVLSKLGCDAECLEYSESVRIYKARLLTESPHSRLPDRLDVTSILGVMSEQGATVVCYSFVHDSLLLWLLKPYRGLVRFYVKRPSIRQGCVKEELKNLISGWESTLNNNRKKNMYKMERRNMEKPTDAMKPAEKEREDKSERAALRRAKSTTQHERNSLKSAKSAVTLDTKQQNNIVDESVAVIQRKLYKFLLSSVDDLLGDLQPNGQLVVIPDDIISHIPFPFLRDLKGKQLKDRFNITMIPGFYALQMIIKNEVSQLQKDDELMFERSGSCLGGFYKYFVSPEVKYMNEDSQGPNESAVVSNPDSKRVSHPRLSFVIRNEDESLAASTMTDQLDQDVKSYSTDKSAHKHVQLAVNSSPTSRAHCTSANFYSFAKPHSPKNAQCKHRKPVTATFPVNEGVPPPSHHTFRPTRGEAANVHKLLRTHNLSTLISRTSTGTDALTSSTSVPEYQQVSLKEAFVVIGNPTLYSNMKFGNSYVKVPEAHAGNAMMQELETVSGILGCEIVSGANATKNNFINLAQKSTVLHIVTYGSLTNGFLLMSCDSSDTDVEECYYVVTCADIMKLKIYAKLVIISSGWKHENISTLYAEQHSLPTAFMIAGVQAVLTIPCPQQSAHMLQFYKHFYKDFQSGGELCHAVNEAVDQVTLEHDIPLFPVGVFGRNVSFDIKSVKSAMLDQRLDKVESLVTESMSNPPLNLPAAEILPSLVEQLTSVQRCMAELSGMGLASQSILSSLIDMVEDGSKLVLQSINKVPNVVTLPFHVSNCPPAVQLLKLLHFHFLPRGRTAQLDEPAVGFPCSDPDGLLDRTLHSLIALQGMIQHECMCRPLADSLPLAQDNISKLVDVLAITKHSPHLQLTTTDDAVKPLWSDQRALLEATGLRQIGLLLQFERSRPNEELLSKTLQFFLMMSAYKSASLLYKLDITELGQGRVESNDKLSAPLSTILPVLLPRDKLTRRVPWASRVESENEMIEKMSLARRCWKTSRFYRKERSNVETIHRSTGSVQAEEAFDNFIIPVSKPLRRKVIAGSTASRNRVSVNFIPPVTCDQMQQRRKYSNFLLSSRLKHVDSRERMHTRQLFRSYTDIVN